MPSPEELECEKHFIETHSRDISGRYIVKLPISKNESTKLGQIRAFAVKMLLSMEKKMKKDLAFAEKYYFEEALKIKNEFVKLLSLGGFPLWSFNHPDWAEKSDNLNIKNPENISTLGIVCSPSLDCFNLKIDVSLKLDEVHTKKLWWKRHIATSPSANFT